MENTTTTGKKLFEMKQEIECISNNYLKHLLHDIVSEYPIEFQATFLEKADAAMLELDKAVGEMLVTIEHEFGDYRLSIEAYHPWGDYAVLNIRVVRTGPLISGHYRVERDDGERDDFADIRAIGNDLYTFRYNGNHQGLFTYDALLKEFFAHHEWSLESFRNI
jgi:hypothetical protein